MEQRTEKLRRFVINASIVSVLIAVGGGITAKVWEPDWNHGGLPKKEHPGGKAVDKTFNPKYVFLLYLDIEDVDPGGQLRMRAVTLQFPSQGYNPKENSSNTWTQNKTEITNWINCLNKNKFQFVEANPNSVNCEWLEYKPGKPNEYVRKEGLEDFRFNQQHHFIVYIQNKDIKYHDTDPIWFGKLRNKKDNNGKHMRASRNWSFFAARPIIPTTHKNDKDGDILIVGDNSPQLIYMKNFYKGRNNFHGGYYDLGKEERNYSLNINAILVAAKWGGSSTITVPIIFDPDTGNMGAGDPPREEGPEYK